MITKTNSLTRSLALIFGLLVLLPSINAMVNPVVSITEKPNAILITTPYATNTCISADDGTNDYDTFMDIIHSEPCERLKKVHQYGPTHFVNPKIVYGGFPESVRGFIDYTRFDHSICVAMIARLKGRPLTEQLACLLHDISHTALSHVGCAVFGNNKAGAAVYQDTILKDFLIERGIAAILDRHGIDLDDVLEKPAFLDRLDYTIVGGWLAGLLKQSEIPLIVNALSFHKPTAKVPESFWYFNSQYDARIVAYCALDLAKINHSAPWNTLVFKLTADALKRAFDLELFSEEDFKYTLGDDDIWNILTTSTDSDICHYMEQIENHETLLEPKTGKFSPPGKKHRNTSSITIAPKFRGFDPRVLDPKMGFRLLSEVDPVFRKDFYIAEATTKAGFTIFASGKEELDRLRELTPSPVLHGF